MEQSNLSVIHINDIRKFDKQYPNLFPGRIFSNYFSAPHFEIENLFSDYEFFVIIFYICMYFPILFFSNKYSYKTSLSDYISNMAKP